MIDTQTASHLEQMCIERGMKMTGQRRVIARVLSDSHDHPDVEELYRRSVKAFSKKPAYWISSISATAARVMKRRRKTITTT